MKLLTNQPRAKKSLGQNFLQAPNICHKITSLVASAAAPNILEIGPGHGALTSHLLELSSNLLLLEKDQHLAFELKKVLPTQALCLLTDALTFSWERLDPSWVVVGNLPYNIASPLIFDLVAKANIALGVFMVQKEVAQRICANPSCKAYGALSIWVQSFGSPKLAFTVPPSCFWPKPKVDSAVLTYTPKTCQLNLKEQAALKALLDICFQQRRKQLGHIFNQAKLTSLAESLPKLLANPTQRPEELSVEQFGSLAQIYAAQIA